MEHKELHFDFLWVNFQLPDFTIFDPMEFQVSMGNTRTMAFIFKSSWCSK